MEETGTMMEILKLYQQRYNAISEIYRLTEEMGELLSKNDQVSVQLVMKMRQDEMEQADRCRTAVAEMEDTMDFDVRQRLKSVVENGGANQIGETFEEKKLQEIAGNIKSVLEKTIELDKRISSRIAGKDSFYAANK